MAKTLSNLRASFLAKINQTSSNHDFQSDYTNIDIYLNEAYLKIAKETGVCRFREALTLTASDADYLIGTDVLATVNNPRILRILDHQSFPLTKITEGQFSLLSDSSGDPQQWTEIYTYSGSPTAMVRTINFWPTPNAATVLHLICEIIPSELSSTTDVPIWDEVFGLHTIIADVALAEALKALGDMRYAAYDFVQDKRVREMKRFVSNERMPDYRDPGPKLPRTGAGIKNIVDYP